MLSATTADSRLSIAASMATVNAEGSSGKIRSARNSGSWNAGRPVGMPPNLVPIVPIWIPAKTQAAVVASRATIVPGTFFVIRGQSRMMAIVARETSTAGTLTVAALFASAIIRGANSLGTSSTARPKKSLICVEAISTAMPLVKPIVTGRGMYRTAEPRPVSPIKSSIAPAIAVHINRPETPNSVTIPATMTTNAPVGPAIWQREPPERRDDETRDNRGVDAGFRPHAGRDGKGHRQGQGDQTDGHAGDEIGGESVPRVTRECLQELGAEAVIRP